MKVDVSPDMGMYNLLKSHSYDTAYALAEFIDNALYAWQNSEERDPQLKVTIKFYSNDYHDSKYRNSILIVDSGPGIKKSRLATAFKPAKKNTNPGLSEFGIGLKSAAIWFSESWDVLSILKNDEQKYLFSFELEKLLESGETSVEIQSEPKAITDKAGVTIGLRNIRRTITNQAFERICIDLRDIYQNFTAGENPKLVLEAEYDGTPQDLKYDVNLPPLVKPKFFIYKSTPYSVGENIKWEIPVNFTYKNITVSGFLRVLEKGSYTDNPGLVLLRYGRVIQGIKNKPNLPENLFGTANKFGRQRIYGVLNLDGLPVNYTKEKFNFDESEFSKCLLAVKGVSDYIDQANSYRSQADEKGEVRHFNTLREFEDFRLPKKNKGATARKSSSQNAPKSSKGNKWGNDQNSAADIDKPILSPIDILRALKPDDLVLIEIVKEAIFQYENNKPISASLCLRIILETGVLRRIEKDFCDEYSTVKGKALYSLFNYIVSNSDKFFGQFNKVAKAFESFNSSDKLGASSLINNQAHGHYALNMNDLNSLLTNSQKILEWAYE